MKGERGHSKSNKWNWNKSTSGFGDQQVEKGNATSGKGKMQQVEKVCEMPDARCQMPDVSIERVICSMEISEG